MPSVRLVEIEPGRFRVLRVEYHRARSSLPCPAIISDIMEPVEQVDGKYYTSKRQYRAVGRAHGLTEVGNEKPKPRRRSSDTAEAKQKRRGTAEASEQERTKPPFSERHRVSGGADRRRRHGV